MEENLQIFEGIDFTALGEWTEEDVRAKVIDPLLAALGWEADAIERERTMHDPKTGDVLRPDYLLKTRGRYALALDAKNPRQDILEKGNVLQAFSYAAHYDVRAHYYALCNGAEFALWRNVNGKEPILHFRLADLKRHYKALLRIISQKGFNAGIKLQGLPIYLNEPKNAPPFDYASRPILGTLPVRKRAAKRHFGVHGYFTRQAWNVVAAYIKNYSQAGDVVLDPYGGSGITMVEALLNDRQAIHIDINPMANFMVEALIAPVDAEELQVAYEEVRAAFIRRKPKDDAAVERILTAKKYKQPADLPLPKGSDVDSVQKLFSPRQMAELLVLKSLIKEQKNENIQKTLMLMFMGVVTRHNLTYHISKAVKADTGFGGDAGPFRYYAYNLAKNPTEIDATKCFDLRYKAIAAAKREIEREYMLAIHMPVEDIVHSAQIIKGSATDMSFLEKESVDYIYTDPPYGEKIQYLDLSVMWNAWLDLEVTENDYRLEAIEDGSREHSFKDYSALITKSLEEMFRVLKFDRWLSFVFAHKNPKYWHLIVEAAQRIGFEYRGTTAQPNGQTSYKKRKNPLTTLAGELIIHFYKARSVSAIMKAQLGMSISEVVMETIEGTIAKHNGASFEQIANELITKAVEMGFLDLLKKDYDDIGDLMKTHFDYDHTAQVYNMRPGSKLTCGVPLEIRVRYYVVSYLRRVERENVRADFNDIVFNVMPMLKNGVNPDEDTILAVLQQVAERDSDGGWRLRKKGSEQMKMDF